MNDNIDAYLTRYNGFVQQLPNETFLQITNCESDIAFGGNLLVELIDICQEVVKVLEVNENIFINEFTDIKGIRQIAYEFGNIREDFNQELIFLRFTHTVSDTIWYSSGFFITEDLSQETTRFEYKNNGYFQGISYDKQNYFQTIRLTCFRNDIDSNIDSETYTQISGTVINLRPIITPIEKFLFYVCDFFTFSRLVILLNHDLVYVNGYKISNKPAPKKGERIEDTNLFNVNFETNPTGTLNDLQYQIYQPFDVVNRILPNNAIINLSILNPHFRLEFNRNISLVAGATAKLYRNSVLVYIITPTKINNILNLDFSGYSFTDAGYSIVISPKSINSNSDFWKGFTFDEWIFTIQGDFNNSDFNNSDFNT